MRILTILFCLFLFACFSDSKRALILSGGGAKGAYQLGNLQYLCETDFRNSWDMVVGTSIGAMNAGGLAMYPKHQFCTSGLNHLHQFWTTLNGVSDIFESWHWLTIGECLKPINFLSLARGWYTNGGMCSTKPGKTRLFNSVTSDKIARSNLELHVSVSPLNDTTKPMWKSNKDPRIVEYVFASGALAPMFPPVKIENMFYIDGGFFTNVPILKAIEEGATEIYVLLLTPLGNQADESALHKANKDEKMGPAVANHFMNIVTRLLLLNSELRLACLEHPDVSIRAMIPRENVGETLGFSPSEIEKMRRAGYDHAAKIGFEDLCAAAARLSGPIGKEFSEILEIRAQANSFSGDGNIILNVGVAVAGVLVGGFIAFAIVNRKRKVQADAFFEIPLPENNSENK
eukprot:c20512_g3_i1.p1 GENE.c20512_g3_i1~~c20512_g3_i1.p1  ORF type:complete len:402 (-),score=164.56 c20512_g3_i1:51-1256(-)